MSQNKTIPTETELEKLKLLHPILQAKLSYVIVTANNENLPVRLFEGLRNYDRQHELFMKGRRLEVANGRLKWVIVDLMEVVTNVDSGDSRHNFALAGDIVFFVNGRWSWDYRLPWDRLGKIGEEAGLTWGGSWPSEDKPHFQFTAGISRTLSRQLYKEGGLDAVWEAVTENYLNGRYS